MTLSILIITMIALAGPLQAHGRKPPPKKSESPSTTLHDVKNDANDALNKVDKGVHQAGHDIQAGANKALQAVDDTVHGRK